ncbi:MAG: transposase [Nanoarchaeota archaeon]|nr:transposase [Nanoarchaeota archaeon]
MDLREYDIIIKKLRGFFSDKKGFVEVPSQTRVSILAACEDPSTVASFEIGGCVWPLPQTGQMWLEHELLKNPELKGVFCITTSYRNEPNPIPGRHDRIFPMFEFESKGGFDDLKGLMRELLEYLGFEEPCGVHYEEMCKRYGVEVLEAEHETQMEKDFGPSVFLEKFPLRTHPFWNMKHRGEGIFNKLDVLLCGMETIGTAERSCNVLEMRENFRTISNGGYAQLLFDSFGKERVVQELENYFRHNMISRFGGGIGVTRLATVMKKKGLLMKNLCV